MNRQTLAHALRAAAAVVDEDQFLVVGSAAILGSYPARLLPTDDQMSAEVDLVSAFDDDNTKADRLDGSLGELSQFHNLHGFAVDGVSIATAVVPPDWTARVRPFAPLDANGVIGWCLHPTDLVVSKAIAHRPKDISFIRAAARHRIVDITAALELLPAVPAPTPRIGTATSLLRRFEPKTPGLMGEQLDIAGRPGLQPFDQSAFGRTLELPSTPDAELEIEP